MMKRIAVIGSTGSIGVQTLEVALERGYEVTALAAGSRIDLLEQQILRHRPRLAAVGKEELAEALQKRLAGRSETKILSGREGVCACAGAEEAELTLNAVVGIAGLAPTVAAIRAKKTLALANKESLVCAGTLVNRLARENGVEILPVDSEHSAIFQCLQGSAPEEVERILLTASGGPFFGKTAEEMEHMTPAQALKHPSWSMGAKITVDSATMMNKGFEIIEARWLFDVPVERVQVVIHRQSIVHSMVEFKDGSIMANIAPPDMELPIAYALSYPERMEMPQRLDIFAMKALEFKAPDEEKFPCLRLAKEAARAGHGAQVVLNAANEALVARFLAGGLRFTDIPRGVEEMLRQHTPGEPGSIDEVLALDEETRHRTEEWMKTR